MTVGEAKSCERPTPRGRSRRTQEIVAAARAILEVHGTDGLTMRRLADSLGIRAPSLYKHLAGRDALEVALVEVGLDEMGGVLHDSVVGPAAGRIGCLLDAYRAIGAAHPNLYRLITSRSFPRDELLPGLEAWAGEPFFIATGDPHRAQALWAFAHGTLTLELDHRFLAGSDPVRTWRAGRDAFVAATASGMTVC